MNLRPEMYDGRVLDESKKSKNTLLLIGIMILFMSWILKRTFQKVGCLSERPMTDTALLCFWKRCGPSNRVSYRKGC